MSEQTMDNRLEVYRLAFIAKLYELSNEFYFENLIRQHLDYIYRCYSNNGFSRETVWFDDGEKARI